MQTDIQQSERPAGLARPGGSALARCPFCGSSKVYVRLYNQPSVCCETCLAMGPATVRRLNKDNQRDLEIEAAKRWNKRVDYGHKITLAQNDPSSATAGPKTP